MFRKKLGQIGNFKYNYLLINNMKFSTHFIIELIIFILMYFTLGITASLIITLFHFIPSIDYFMKITNVFPKLKFQLFHNIFIMFLGSIPIFYYTNILIGSLAILNFILHMLMDIRDPKGIMLLFSFSQKRIRIG